MFGESLRILGHVSAEIERREMGTSVAYNGNFATELVLDLALLDCVGGFIFDDGEELFNTHLGE